MSFSDQILSKLNYQFLFWFRWETKSSIRNKFLFLVEIRTKKLVKRENPSWFHSYIFQGLVLLSMSRWFHTKFPAHRKQNKNDFLHFGQFLTVERDSPPRKLLSSGLKYEFSEAWCKSWLNLKYLKMFLTSFDLIWPRKWPSRKWPSPESPPVFWK